jgi:limonene 1,2-monooxygenase
MFLAAAGERSKRIKLATGVISLPYHHPFNVAQRMVQLDHMTGGRAIFGSGPGALASDAHTLGIDPMLLRDRQDEAIGIIRRLFRGERVTARSDWFELQDAALQLLPLQEEMPCAVASQISPSGMTLAGTRHRHHLDRVAVGGRSERPADAMGLRGGRRRQARPDRRPEELARAAELAHRRDS